MKKRRFEVAHALLYDKTNFAECPDTKLILTEPIFKRCIAIFELLRKSLRAKTELKILPIFVFFSQIV